MNAKIIEFLNKKYRCSLKTDYYNNISGWKTWWNGYNQQFHHYKYSNGDRIIEKDMYSLKMGKKVCMDWASILLNQKTRITVDDKATSKFLQGKDEMGGVLGLNRFWRCGNKLIEKAFALGTGAVAVHFTNLKKTDSGKIFRTPRTQIKLNYISAENIIILSKENDIVTEVAFCSERTEDGKSYIYLEVHNRDDSGNYVIENFYFRNESGFLTPAPLPPNMFPVIKTNSPVPLFSLISPNITPPDNSGGFGVSILADAVDVIKGIDLAYNNLNNDFYLGSKKVFMNKDIMAQTQDGKKIAPDDVNQQLFTFIGDGLEGDDEKNKLLYEFNPVIRVTENTDGVQAQLDYLSFKVGFGTKHYQFNSGSIVTATQYTGDKQDLIQNANKHYIAIEEFLLQLVRAILWAGKNVLGEAIDPETPITIIFDKSALIDDDAEKMKDKEDVAAGIMQKWEYRVKWYGETEEQAKKILSESETDDEIMSFGGDG